MAGLTPFGKAVRKIRIDRAETLGDMAAALGISAAFLSSIETGKRNIPAELLETLIIHCGLDAARSQELRRLAIESRNSVTVKPTERTRELAAAFARKFDELDTTQIEELLKVLNKPK